MQYSTDTSEEFSDNVATTSHLGILISPKLKKIKRNLQFVTIDYCETTEQQRESKDLKLVREKKDRLPANRMIFEQSFEQHWNNDI